MRRTLTTEQLADFRAEPGERTVEDAVADPHGPELIRWANTVADVKATTRRDQRPVDVRACGSRGRAPRASTNARSRGSRRSSTRSSGGGSSGDPDDGESDESDPGLDAGGCTVATGADSATGGTLAERIVDTLATAGNVPASGLPVAFTYAELADVVYDTDETTASQLSMVRQAVSRLVAEGAVVKATERRAFERGAVEVHRPLTPEDHERRRIATQPLVDRIEAKRKATPYSIDTGYPGTVDVMVEPVLVIREDGVELRQPGQNPKQPIGPLARLA